MLTKLPIFTLVALICLGQVMPQPGTIPRAAKDSIGKLIGQEDIIEASKHGIAIDGALDQASKILADGSATHAAATSIPDADEDASALTIRITNAWHAPISTRHSRNVDSPPAVGGDVGPGMLGVWQVGQFAVPTQWAGMVAVVNAADDGAVAGDESLIEASFMDQLRGSGRPVVDVDVSYVDGFSLPITCSCGGRVVTGCNKQLWRMGHCPDDNGRGSCRNPNRRGGRSPAKFFAPCHGAAYTFPYDHGANSNGDCTGGVVDCCVGERCPANPKQPS